MPVRTRPIATDYATAHKVRALTGIGTYALLRMVSSGLVRSPGCTRTLSHVLHGRCPEAHGHPAWSTQAHSQDQKDGQNMTIK